MCDFKKDIAVRYGVNAAVIAQFLWDSIEGPDHSSKRVCRDGKKWCRCSILMMTGIFPFLSRHMVSDALKSLCDKKRLPEQQQIRPHKLVCLHRIW